MQVVESAHELLHNHGCVCLCELTHLAHCFQQIGALSIYPFCDDVVKSIIFQEFKDLQNVWMHNLFKHVQLTLDQLQLLLLVPQLALVYHLDGAVCFGSTTLSTDELVEWILRQGLLPQVVVVNAVYFFELAKIGSANSRASRTFSIFFFFQSGFSETRKSVLDCREGLGLLQAGLNRLVE